MGVNLIIIWQNNIKLTKSVNFKENIYKMFYRWHTTPEKLSKIYTDVSNVCWKCEAHVGSYYHMWWTCRVTKQYWIGVHTV